MKAGEIIVRQRGTEWHAGENVKMGLDHTLYATAPGWVRFYRPEPPPMPAPPRAHDASLLVQPLPFLSALPKLEPIKSHPSSARRKLGRRYVGVGLSQDSKLPSRIGAPRERLFTKVNLAAGAQEQLVARTGESGQSEVIDFEPTQLLGAAAGPQS